MLQIISIFYRIWIGNFIFITLFSFLTVFLDFEKSKKRLILASKEVKSMLLNPIYLLLILYFLLHFLMLTSDGISSGDSHYHLQNVKWLENYGTVYGLGLIHGRLAFGSAWLLLQTFFGFSFLWGEPLITIQYFILFLFFIFSLEFINIDKSSFFRKILVIISLLFLSQNIIAKMNTSTDIIPNYYVLIVLMLWFNAWEDKKNRSIYFVLIVFLSAFAVICKISVAPIVIIAGFSGLFLIMSKDVYKYKTLTLIIIMGLLITIPFFIRNIIQSGYLVYPFPAVDIFNVDWKIIPEVQYMDDKAWIESWALKPGPMLPLDELSFSERASIWSENIGHLKVFYIQVVLVFFLMILSELYKIFIKKDIKIRDFISLYPVIITLLSLIFLWFFTAPDYRFLFTPFHFVIALSVANIITNFININSIMKYIKHSYISQKIVTISQKIILTIFIIITILLFTLACFGNYERIGYFDTFELIDNSNNNFTYKSRMKFNDKIFKHSDIFSITSVSVINKEKQKINFINFNSDISQITFSTTEVLKDNYTISASYKSAIKINKIRFPLLLLLILIISANKINLPSKYIVIKIKKLNYIKLKREYFLFSCILLAILFFIITGIPNKFTPPPLPDS